MARFLRTASLVVIATVGLASTGQAAASRAEAIGESRAVSTPLSDNATALTYWVNQPDGWHVVTTVDTVMAQEGSEGHAIVRFSATLLPGQSQLISVPVALGTAPEVLRISRRGNRIEVERVPGSS